MNNNNSNDYVKPFSCTLFFDKWIHEDMHIDSSTLCWKEAMLNIKKSETMSDFSYVF